MTILIFDGNNAAHRAKYVLDVSWKGEDTSIIYGMISILKSSYVKLSQQYGQVDAMIVCWDMGKPPYRRELIPEYKANRVYDPDDIAFQDFIRQVDILHDVLSLFGILSVRQQGLEADDLIAAMWDTLTENTKIIISTDKDMWQLVEYDCMVYNPITERMLTQFNFEEVVGFPFSTANYPHPETILLYRAIVGDISDNLKGIPGVGAVTAKKIIDSISFMSPEEVLGTTPAKLESLVGKAFAKKIVDNGLQFLRNTYDVMSLFSNAAFLAIDIVGVVLDTWEKGNLKEVNKFLKKYMFASLVGDPSLVTMVKNLKNPADFI